MPNPHLQTGKRIGQGLPVGIVEMARQVIEVIVPERRLHGALHLDRGTHANRVSHANMLHADSLHEPRHLFHPLRRNLAFIRTSHCTGDGTANKDATRAGTVHHWPEALNAFGDGAIDIALAKGFTGSREHHHLIGPR